MQSVTPPSLGCTSISHSNFCLRILIQSKVFFGIFGTTIIILCSHILCIFLLLYSNIIIDMHITHNVFIIYVYRFFVRLRLTHPTPGIEPGGRIEVCDYYSTSSVSATLETLPRW